MRGTLGLYSKYRPIPLWCWRVLIDNEQEEDYMKNQVTSVTRNSWGSRIADSFMGVIVGIILIPLCLWGLWTNEGTKDVSKLAKMSVVVASDSVDPSKDGVFASISGELTSDEQIGDEPYMLPGAYITLDRSAEMYAWKETSQSTETKDTVGGGSTTTTTYTYSNDWTASPEDSSSFNQPADHQNPAKTIDDASSKAGAAAIGAYSFDPQAITLPDGVKIDVTPADGLEGFFSSGPYLYNRNGADSAPQVGDMRISYTALKVGTSVTAMGKLNAGAIESYTDESITQGERTLHRIFIGTRDEGIAQLRNEFLLWIWAIRILGVVGLWLGLNLLGGPIVKILDVVGVVGSIAGGIWGFISFFVALVVGVTTIIVSMLFHNIYFLIFFVVVVIAGVVYYLRNRSRKALATGQVPSASNLAGTVNNTAPKMN